MNKKILGGIAVLVIATAMAFSVNFNTNNYNLSDLSLANVEALAINEGGGGDRVTCWMGETSKSGVFVEYYCGNCEAADVIIYKTDSCPRP